MTDQNRRMTDFGDRGRGSGDYQLTLRQLTEMKLIQKLAVRPWIYEELRKETRIHRNKLRERLDYLVSARSVLRHKYSFPESENHVGSNNTDDFPIPGKDYYILNLDDARNRHNLISSKPILPDFSNNSLNPKLSYQEKQEAEKMIRKYNEIKKSYDSIDFAPVPSIYRTEKERRKMIEEFEPNAKEYSHRPVMDGKINQTINEINKQYSDELFCLFKKKEQLEEQLQQPVRGFATNLVALTYTSINNGYSPLDVLIYHSCRKPYDRQLYKLIWDILDKSGFLGRYLFSGTNKR